MTKLSLSPSIISSDDLRGVIEEIETFKQWFSHSSIKALVGGKRKKSEQLELSVAAKELITAWQEGKPPTVGSLDRLISELEQYLKQSSKVRITLAAVPSRGLKQEIAGWCRSNVSEKLLIDFRYSSVILGGMVVAISSHIYDWSFRRQLLDSSDKLTEVIHRV